MQSTNSRSGLVIKLLKQAAGALMALIGGLLMVGIGIFLLGLANTGDISSVPLQAFVVICFAFFAAAPVWLLFYLPCHLLTPPGSVLWQPWVCVPLGALAGAAAFYVELSIITWGHTWSDGPWIQNEAILAACVGASTCLAGSWIVRRSEKRTQARVVEIEE